MENVGVSANYMLKQRIKSTIYFIICVLIALICLVPIYLLLMNATRSDAELARAPLSLIPSGSLIHNIKAIPTQYSGWSVPWLCELFDRCRRFDDPDGILLCYDCIWSDCLRFQGS